MTIGPRIAPRRGRPPRATSASRRRIEILVTEEERRVLDRVARENHCSLATMIRDAVNDYVADYSEERVF